MFDLKIIKEIFNINMWVVFQHFYECGLLFILCLWVIYVDFMGLIYLCFGTCLDGGLSYALIGEW